MKKQPIEIWKDIPGYKGMYQVSSLGRVRGLDRLSSNGRKVKGKIIKPYTNSDMLYMGLSKKGKGKTYTVEELVASAFIGYNKSKNKSILHIDGDVFNNCSNNLRLVENTGDIERIEKQKKSIYVGPYRLVNNTGFAAQVYFNNEYVFLGKFDTMKEAVIAYNDALQSIKRL